MSNSNSTSACKCPCGGGQSCIVDRRSVGDFVLEDLVREKHNLPLRTNCYTPINDDECQIGYAHEALKSQNTNSPVIASREVKRNNGLGNLYFNLKQVLKKPITTTNKVEAIILYDKITAILDTDNLLWNNPKLAKQTEQYLLSNPPNAPNAP
jgi:hypothetical protein